MNRRLIAQGTAGAVVFSAVYEAGVYAVPGPMEALPTAAGLICPPLVALLWAFIVAPHHGDDGHVAPYVPREDRRALPPAQRRALERSSR